MSNDDSNLRVDADVQTTADGFRVHIEAKTPTTQTGIVNATPVPHSTLQHPMPKSIQQGISNKDFFHAVRDAFLEYTRHLMPFLVIFSTGVLIIHYSDIHHPYHPIVAINIIVVYILAVYSVFIFSKMLSILAPFDTFKNKNLSLLQRVYAAILFSVVAGIPLFAIGFVALKFRYVLFH
jgi:hypothetical protein